MRLMPISVLQTSTPPMAISRLACSYCATDSLAACRTKTVLQCHKMCTLKHIRLRVLELLQDHSGALQLQLQRLKVPDQLHIVRGTTGADVWQKCKTRSLSLLIPTISETESDLQRRRGSQVLVRSK